MDKGLLVEELFSNPVIIPEEYCAAAVKKIPEINLADIHHSGCGACFFGDPGLGKTFAATALAKRAVLAMASPEYRYGIDAWKYPDNSIAWIEVPYLLASIRDTFRNQGGKTELEIIDRCVNAKVLLLDDLGAEKQSAFTGATLYTILSRRRNRKRYTIITTNQNLELIEAWEPRIASRIGEMLHVKLPRKDWRMKK